MAIIKLSWRPVLMTVLTVIFSQLLKAQNNSGDRLAGIKGVVVDSASKKPLDFVTVALKTDSGQVVKSVLTKAGGSFTAAGLRSGGYRVSVVSVGYRVKNLTVKITASGPAVKDLGIIGLQTLSHQLKEVAVTGSRPLVRQEIDRLSYDLQADPESKGSNVLEMMRKVPMLSVDAEDNILLKGNNNYKILVNGKPSSMMERNPKDILRSMPASSIERIEVITTPPAKYDGEGLAGIINIITNKKADNGYNGSVNLNGRFPAGGPGAGGSFTLKSGKFGLAVNGGGSLSNVPAIENSRYRETFGINPTILTQSIVQESDGRNGYFNTELSFEPDSLQLISGQFNINGNRGSSESVQASLLSSDEDIVQRYNLDNDYIGKGKGIDAGLNYQLGFKSDKNRLLTVSYRYFGFQNRQFNGITVSEPLNYSDPDYRQDNVGKFSEQTAQLDYVHPLKKITVEAGIKAIIRDNKSDYGYSAFDASAGDFIADPSRTNNFNNTQNVYGAYNTYQYAIKDWGFKGGARLERTVIEADFTSAGQQLKKDYLNVIPSVSVNRKLTKNSSLNLGYTTRIQRPGIDRLNPFVDRSNPNFESTGNPDLRPASADMIQLNYSNFKKGSFNAGLSLGFFHRLIMPVSVFDPETNITRTSYGNTGHARLIGFHFDCNYPLTKKWKFNLNSNFGYGKVEGLVNGENMSNEGLMPFVYSSTDYRFDNGWRLSANMCYYGRNISLQGKSNGTVSSAFGVNRELVKDKLTFSATANNVFTRYRSSENRTTGLDFVQQNINQSYFRSFSASLDYRFGKLKDGIKKSKRGIRNDDIASGTN